MSIQQKDEGDHRFVRACRGQSVDRTPIWIMRQAGRYLPEYRELRTRHSFRELLSNPELAAEVTLQPIERFDLDAAIIFSDILVATEVMGVPFEIVPGKGPVLDHPIRSSAEIEKLVIPDMEQSLGHLTQAIRLVVERLGGRIPLIGFAGAPFTLACYLVEGGPSKTFNRMRQLCYEQPAVATRLLERIGEAVIELLKAQIRAGVEVVQIFESWAGVLSPQQYQAIAAPATTAIFNALEDEGVPRILYVGHTGHYLEQMTQLPVEVLSIDWRTSLGQAAEILPKRISLQGNLDPCALFLPEPELGSAIGRVLDEVGTSRGHIFNLGHGIIPEIDPEKVRFLVDAVHRRTSR